MSAQVLREAAALMRARAEAATGGGWHDGGVWWEHWTDAEGRLCHTPWPTITTGDTGAEIVGKVTTEADATHIATFANPAVALAVADWLEDVAATHDDPYNRENYDDLMRPALAVANAYLASPPH